MTIEIAFHNYAVRFKPRARELFTICVLCIVSIESFGKIGRSSRRFGLSFAGKFERFQIVLVKSCGTERVKMAEEF